MSINKIYHRSALDVLKSSDDCSVDLIYVDPPFGTGNVQTLRGTSYDDSDVNYKEFLFEHIVEFKRILKQTGSLYLHLDWRFCHHARIICDDVFGCKNFLNEIIWAYDFGGRGKDRWPRKHDNILVYVKEMGKHIFNWNDIERVPYAAPEMQRVGRSAEEAEKRIAAGKVPTDVWNMSIVGTNSKERNGYPTQKPVKLIERAVLASSPSDGTVLDVFAGSGTTGEAAHKHGRNFMLADVSQSSIDTMKRRFANVNVTWVE